VKNHQRHYENKKPVLTRTLGSTVFKAAIATDSACLDGDDKSPYPEYGE